MKFSLVVILVFVFFLPISVYVLYNELIRDASLVDTSKSTILPTDTQVVLPQTDGGNIETENFLKNPEIKADIYNENEYFLGNDFSNTAIDTATSSYVIAFDAETKYFNIALLKKPLSTARMEMETYLKNTLKISEKDMCALDYTVSVPGYVDEAASGIDYRFSFCPGSVQL